MDLGKSIRHALIALITTTALAGASATISRHHLKSCKHRRRQLFLPQRHELQTILSISITVIPIKTLPLGKQLMART
ncbi:MAG: hypothetical protein ACFWT8_13605 [Lacticaseibacillus casei]|jgi:hypothetical protein